MALNLASREQKPPRRRGKSAYTKNVELPDKAGHLLDSMVPNFKRTSDLVRGGLG